MKYKKEIFTYTLLLLIVILLSVWMFKSESKLSQVPFSPDNPKENGTMALSEVLRNKGTNLQIIDSIEDTYYASEKDAIVVINPQNIPKDRLQELEENGYNDIFFMNTYNAQFQDIEEINSSKLTEIKAQCKTESFNTETKISGSFLSLKIDEEKISDSDIEYKINKCFPIELDGETSYAYIEKISDTYKTSYIADPSIFTNKEITKSSNAAVALNLFNKYKNIYWYMPTKAEFEDPSNAAPPLTPSWAGQIFLLICIATIFLLLAKGKRLGFVIKENLPVVVKFEETNTGKANLYRKNNDQDYTANILRTYHIQKLAKLVRINPQINKEEFIRAVSEKANIKYEDVEKILYTQETQSNEELHVLSLSLESIEKKVKDGKQ